MPETLFTAKLT